MSGNGGNEVKPSSKVYFRQSLQQVIPDFWSSSGFHLKWNSARVLLKIVRNWHTWSRFGKLPNMHGCRKIKANAIPIPKVCLTLFTNMACRFSRGVSSMWTAYLQQLMFPATTPEMSSQARPLSNTVRRTTTAEYLRTIFEHAHFW